ncbi:MAG: glycosyltransferase family 2 protein [Rhizobiaceae bacterium]
MKISFVTTIYKTGRSIQPFVDRVLLASKEMGFEYEIIFVNDASPDDGLELAKNLADSNSNIKVIDLARNYGQHKALWTGMEASCGDFVMILDGDMEEDPYWSKEFYNIMHQNDADVVFGIQKAPKGNFAYRIFRRIFYRILSFLSDFDFPRNVTTARLMKREYVDVLKSFEEREIWLVGVLHSAGFKQISAPVDKFKSDPTTYSIAMLVRLFITAITAFSIKPLIGVFISGIVISFLAFVYIGVLLMNYLFSGIGVPGWTSVMAGMFLMGGILTSFVGIIAIYVGTIFNETKRRPRTIIKSVYQAPSAPLSVSKPRRRKTVRLQK